jgi:hypothetical protein
MTETTTLFMVIKVTNLIMPLASNYVNVILIAYYEHYNQRNHNW